MRINHLFNPSMFVLLLFCLYFLAISLMIFFMQRDIENLNTEVKELRILFNQKFLQEMVVNKPSIKFEF